MLVLRMLVLLLLMLLLMPVRFRLLHLAVPSVFLNPLGLRVDAQRDGVDCIGHCQRAAHKGTRAARGAGASAAEEG